MRQSNFQFLNPRLIDLKFSVNPDFIPQNENNIEMKNAFHIQVNREKNSANVELILEINLEDENAPFEMKVTVGSEFIWNSDLDEENIKNMLSCNAPALLLSYMRPIVANVTNMADFPPYNLPFMNFKE